MAQRALISVVETEDLRDHDPAGEEEERPDRLRRVWREHERRDEPRGEIRQSQHPATADIAPEPVGAPRSDIGFDLDKPSRIRHYDPDWLRGTGQRRRLALNVKPTHLDAEGSTPQRS